MIILTSILAFLLGFVLAGLLSNSKRQEEIAEYENEMALLRKANEEMYEKGKQDMVRELSKEIIDDHILTFQKIPKKKFISVER